MAPTNDDPNPYRTITDYFKLRRDARGARRAPWTSTTTAGRSRVAERCGATAVTTAPGAGRHSIRFSTPRQRQSDQELRRRDDRCAARHRRRPSGHRVTTIRTSPRPSARSSGAGRWRSRAWCRGRSRCGKGFRAAGPAGPLPGATRASGVQFSPNRELLMTIGKPGGATFPGAATSPMTSSSPPTATSSSPKVMRAPGAMRLRSSSSTPRKADQDLGQYGSARRVDQPYALAMDSKGCSRGRPEQQPDPGCSTRTATISARTYQEAGPVAAHQERHPLLGGLGVRAVSRNHDG